MQIPTTQIDQPPDTTDAAGCCEPTPLPPWRDALGASVAGAIVGVVLGVSDVPVSRAVLAAIGTVSLLVAVAMVVNRLLTPIHADCDTCGACSVLAGIPTGQTDAALDRALLAAGWTIDDDVITCGACVRSVEQVD